MDFVLLKIVTVPKGRKFTINKKSQITFMPGAGDEDVDLSKYNGYVVDVFKGDRSQAALPTKDGLETWQAGEDCSVRLTKI